MKQAIALIISLILMISCFVGCSDNQKENSNGDIDEGMSGMVEMPDDTNGSEEDDTTLKPPVLEEMTELKARDTTPWKMRLKWLGIGTAIGAILSSAVWLWLLMFK